MGDVGSRVVRVIVLGVGCTVAAIGSGCGGRAIVGHWVGTYLPLYQETGTVTETFVLGGKRGGTWTVDYELNGVFEESEGSVLWSGDDEGGWGYSIDIRCSFYQMRDGTQVVDEQCPPAGHDVRECHISEGTLFCNPTYDGGSQGEFERIE